ncbi:hypothetical protein OKA05_12480 [Luteolibacter arcticus]|uniref:Uncharacterized protein n=1 Tax=Luteolibacter arcticus TaxID=1581411 RepID=A0ABT3GIM1_9BACT|nr:hypothetical protein [Luteolibacter arcticus]MCW1923373.1 hypothetical protein [Luteolibacter arcticus]
MKFPDETSPKSHPVRDWVTRQLVQQVPAELATCEFSCSANQCSAEEWSHCSRRKLAAEAARDTEPGS